MLTAQLEQPHRCCEQLRDVESGQCFGECEPQQTAVLTAESRGLRAGLYSSWGQATNEEGSMLEDGKVSGWRKHFHRKTKKCIESNNAFLQSDIQPV